MGGYPDFTVIIRIYSILSLLTALTCQPVSILFEVPLTVCDSHVVTLYLWSGENPAIPISLKQIVFCLFTSYLSCYVIMTGYSMEFI